MGQHDNRSDDADSAKGDDPRQLLTQPKDAQGYPEEGCRTTKSTRQRRPQIADSRDTQICRQRWSDQAYANEQKDTQF